MNDNLDQSQNLQQASHDASAASDQERGLVSETPQPEDQRAPEGSVDRDEEHDQQPETFLEEMNEQLELTVSNDSASPVTAGLDKEYFGLEPCHTPEIDIACKKIANWIRTDMPGCIASGLRRVGKTYFCEYLHTTVYDMMGGTTTSVLWKTLSMNATRDLEYLRDRMRQAGVDGYNHRNTGILLPRLTDGLKAQVSTAGARRLLLIVDEAQLTSESQIGYLGDIHNELSGDVKVFVLLVGQTSLAKLDDTLKSPDAQNIASRFFQLRHEFRGIALRDLAGVMDSLDNASGGSVVGRHFPSLAARGWTLGNAAPTIVTALEAMSEQMTIKHEMRLPMECVRALANTLLYRMEAARDNPLTVITTKAVTQFIRSTRYDKILHRYQVEVQSGKA